MIVFQITLIVTFSVIVRVVLLTCLVMLPCYYSTAAASKASVIRNCLHNALANVELGKAETPSTTHCLNIVCCIVFGLCFFFYFMFSFFVPMYTYSVYVFNYYVTLFSLAFLLCDFLMFYCLSMFNYVFDVQYPGLLNICLFF